MSWLDLLAPRPGPAAAAARRWSLRSRVGEMLRPVPDHTAYVAPRLRAAEGLAFAVRGYVVFWSGGGVQPDGRIAGARLVYGTNGGTMVEVPTVVPGGVHRLASWVGTARLLGWGFALEQAKREHGWMREAQRRLRRRR